MTDKEMVKFISERVPLPSLLMGLAEECAELQQGLHKLERAIRGENPTTVTPMTSVQWINEELSDVLLYAEILSVLGYEPDDSRDKKLKRWVERLNMNNEIKVLEE